MVMNKILPGLYIGNMADSRDQEQLLQNKITHILSLLDDNVTPVSQVVKYKYISVKDSLVQDLSKHFWECTEFIHQARMDNGIVLVHCIAGASRSPTIVASYLMTITKFRWQDAIQAIRCCRSNAYPNSGFQKQLKEFDSNGLAGEARSRLLKKYKIDEQDEEYIQDVLRTVKES